MKQKILLIIGALVVILLMIIWLFFGPATQFKGQSKYIYIRDGKDAKMQLQRQLEENHLIRNTGIFYFVADQFEVWKRVKSGRFEIQKGQSLYNILQNFRHSVQSPVKLIINKIRVKEDLARIIGKNFSTDSLTAINFLANLDSLQSIGADTNTLTSFIIPNTYLLNWNTSTRNIIKRLQKEQEKFWSKENRLQKAGDQGLSSLQVMVIASIVEEETNKNDEKGNIASVYINRYNRQMPLGADPTIKFALKNFALKRILFNDLNVSSPYNTYRNAGLPPGPICTPSATTIDAVLNAPKTDFIFFVAKSDFSGYHHFSANYAEHQQYAKQYQQALTEWLKRKALQNTP